MARGMGVQSSFPRTKRGGDLVDEKAVAVEEHGAGQADHLERPPRVRIDVKPILQRDLVHRHLRVERRPRQPRDGDRLRLADGVSRGRIDDVLLRELAHRLGVSQSDVSAMIPK